VGLLWGSGEISKKALKTSQQQQPLLVNRKKAQHKPTHAVLGVMPKAQVMKILSP
jgi:hypothetical protein